MRDDQRKDIMRMRVSPGKNRRRGRSEAIGPESGQERSGQGVCDSPGSRLSSRPSVRVGADHFAAVAGRESLIDPELIRVPWMAPQRMVLAL